MRNIKLAKNLPFAVPEIEDITDSLPKRKTWEEIGEKKWTVRGKWDGHTYLHGFRKETDINRIIVHHSGPPEGTLASHANYHAGKWGAGIAYHIAIDRGKIYQCNDLLSMTYHAAGNNTDSIAIMVNRDLRNGDLTDAERKLLYAAIITVKKLFKIQEVLGHNECCPTECPVTKMVTIRTDIFNDEKSMALNDTLDTTPNANMAKVFSAHTRFEDLYKLATTSGPNQSEAVRKCIQVADMMVQTGILKA